MGYGAEMQELWEYESKLLEGGDISCLKGMWEIERGRGELSFLDKGPACGSFWRGGEWQHRVTGRRWNPDSLLTVSLGKSLELMGPQCPHL